MIQSSNHVFICYRRDDSADITGRFYDRLVSRFGKDAIFKDVDSIPLGVDFRTHVDQTIRNCSVVLVMIGERWLDARDESGVRRLDQERDHVRIEIQSALAREVPIVPVIVGKATHPSPGDLPESIQSLAFRNGTSLRSDPHFHSDAGYIIDHLATHLLSPDAGVTQAIVTEPSISPTPAPGPSFHPEKLDASWRLSILAWLSLWITAGGLAGSIADLVFVDLFNRLYTDMNATAPWYASAAPIFLSGVLLGLFQWLVLRLRLQGIGWWLPVTASALLLGDIVGYRAAQSFQPPANSQSYQLPVPNDPPQLHLVSTEPAAGLEAIEAPAAVPAAVEAVPETYEPSPIEEEANRRRNAHSSITYAACIGLILGLSQHLLLRRSSLPLQAWLPTVLFSQVMLALIHCPAAMDWSGDTFSRSLTSRAFHGFISGSFAALATAIPLGIAITRIGSIKHGPKNS